MKNGQIIKRDDKGNINISDMVLKNYSIDKHKEYIIYEEGGKIIMIPSIHSISRIYIEPTSLCNLNCITCIRNNWEEKPGGMDMNTFNKFLQDLDGIPSVSSIMFGGFGEPMFHPDIYSMIKSISDKGIKTEMTTNGTMLNEDTIEKLFQSNLSRLWVSVDSMDTDNYNRIREGGDFSKVYNSLKLFKRINQKKDRKIQLGIAFVVTKDNADDLSRLRSFAGSVWAEYISVSNVIPYEREMEDKMLCRKKLFKPLTYTYEDERRMGFKEIVLPEISLPRIDYNDYTKEGLYDIYASMMKIKTLGEEFKEYRDYCRFINEGITFLRWDGEISPCMGLLHTYKTYLNGNERLMKEHSFGSIHDSSLKEIWDSEEYHDFREKVYNFEFSPCVLCGGCEDVASNEKDCLTDSFPACGGCLWAQGVIQCP